MDLKITPAWNVQLLWRNSLEISFKVKHMPYDASVLLRGTYLREMKDYVHTNTCTLMLTAAVFIVAKSWTQPK